MAPLQTECRPTIRHRLGVAITAEIVIDIRRVNHAEAERRVWAIEACPPGSTVRLRVDADPREIIRSVIGARVRQFDPGVRIVVEAPDAHTARRWIDALRGDHG